MLSPKEKMLAGLAYNASDPTLMAERRRAHTICHSYNAGGDPSPASLAGLTAIFKQAGQGLYIEPPFFCDYGYNITMGDRVYLNFNVTVKNHAVFGT